MRKSCCRLSGESRGDKVIRYVDVVESKCKVKGS